MLNSWNAKRDNRWLRIGMLMLSTALSGSGHCQETPREATLSDHDLKLDMSDPKLWTMDTVHLGTKQVDITYAAGEQAAVMTPTWSPRDSDSSDTGVRNIENGRLQLYQLVHARDCTQADSYIEINMPQEYIDEGKLELVFALQAGAKGDYLFNGRTFTMEDFADSAGTYKKLIVRPPDYNEPVEKLRAIERISFIFERKGSLVSAPVKIRRVEIDLNSEKIAPPAPEVRIKNPKSFYEFTYNKQADVDGIEVRESAESMDITRRVNDTKDGMALIPQWKEGQVPDGHSGRVTLVQPLGAVNDFERFEAEYVLNIPKAYFDEGKLDLWLFVQAGEAGYYRWSGTQRTLASFAEKAGQDLVLKMTEEDVRQGKKRNQIEVMGFQLDRNGSTVTEPIMLKRISVKLPESETPAKETPAKETSFKTEASGSSRFVAIRTVAANQNPRVTVDESFVKNHGQLSVRGTKLVDAQDEPIVLRGVSYGWHNWWHQFYNAGTVGWLTKDWNCTVVRAAMGVGPRRSYLDKPEWSQQLVRTVVEAAIANDIYVIIDWHDHNAHKHTDEAVAFFTEMATLYGDQPNVIYEIYNEPVNVSWPEVKRYSKKVIDAIRAIDQDNIILVGSPHWDQDVHIAADAPLSGEKNIMYTLHFYADTHKQELRDRGDYALSKGLPLFVSEYGGCAANGDGPLNMEEWNAWVAWMEKHQISSVTWSISAKDETCSMLPAEAADTGNWPADTLKPSGVYTRKLLKHLNRSQPTTPSDNRGSRPTLREAGDRF